MLRLFLLTVVVVGFGVGASPAVAAPSIPWATQSVALNSASEADTEAISTLADGSAIVTGLFKGTVAFGSTVTITRKGRQQTFRIVGVDEADASNGMISHRSPMAQAILGARPGDIVEAPEPLGEIDILSTQGRN